MSEETFYRNIDNWIRMPDLQQKQQELENKLFTLETLLDYEIKGDEKTLYAQKSNIFFLQKASDVIQEKQQEKEKIEKEIETINSELDSLTSSFHSFKQNVSKKK
ncbi:hypothetical protein FDP41_013132 [Naegleria fowleri]|uniref:Uncharacterized protein n=1 Tax=Naegleria fowleri TaxID=5763 RepID=A0A6A5C5P2_NAEFO|nr:uncharacterized protein FDP41_013132 [Naegleria fowleri]KAF0980649.1 hypothetical protein FDP41_013132 [Naegleria fowleri]